MPSTCTLLTSPLASQCLPFHSFAQRATIPVSFQLFSTRHAVAGVLQLEAKAIVPQPLCVLCEAYRVQILLEKLFDEDVIRYLSFSSTF